MIVTWLRRFIEICIVQKTKRFNGRFEKKNRMKMIGKMIKMIGKMIKMIGKMIKMIKK